MTCGQGNMCMGWVVPCHLFKWSGTSFAFKFPSNGPKPQGNVLKIQPTLNPLFQTSFEAFELPNVPNFTITWEVQIAWLANGDGDGSSPSHHLPPPFFLLCSWCCCVDWWCSYYYCYTTPWCQRLLQHAMTLLPPSFL